MLVPIHNLSSHRPVATIKTIGYDGGYCNQEAKIIVSLTRATVQTCFAKKTALWKHSVETFGNKACGKRF